MMKRSPIKRKVGLKRSIKPMKKTALRKVSKKQIRRLGDYKKTMQEYLAAHDFCERCGLDFRHGHAKSLHHKRGRGKYLADPRYYSALCISRHNHFTNEYIEGCHDWVEAHKKEARNEGWVLYD